MKLGTKKPLSLLFVLLTTIVLSGCSYFENESAPEPRPSATSQEVTLEDTGATLSTRDFQIVMTLDATTEVSAGIQLVPDSRFELSTKKATGSKIKAEQRIGKLKINAQLLDSLKTQSKTSTIEADRLAKLQALEGDVLAPVAGVLDISTPTAILQTPGTNAASDLTPNQRLRTMGEQFTGEATVETIIGKRTVPCVSIWTVESKLQCRLPAYIETAPGLRASVTVKSLTIPGALVVPNTYLYYSNETANYMVNLILDGTTTPTPVTIGPTDGIVTVITSQLTPGTQVATPS